MSISFNLYDAAMLAQVNGTMPAVADGMHAILLADSYVPSITHDATLGDIQGHEISGGDYQRHQLTGVSASVVGAEARLTSGSLHFGNPVAIPWCRWCVLVMGGVLSDSSPLLAVADLGADIGEGASVRSINGIFELSPPAEGWLALRRLS